jgi:hypothetical protein
MSWNGIATFCLDETGFRSGSDRNWKPQVEINIKNEANFLRNNAASNNNKKRF